MVPQIQAFSSPSVYHGGQRMISKGSFQIHDQCRLTVTTLTTLNSPLSETQNFYKPQKSQLLPEMDHLINIYKSVQHRGSVDLASQASVCPSASRKQRLLAYLPRQQTKTLMLVREHFLRKRDYCLGPNQKGISRMCLPARGFMRGQFSVHSSTIGHTQIYSSIFPFLPAWPRKPVNNCGGEGSIW